MAVQAQLYSENLDFLLGSSHDLMILENACGFDNQLCPKPEKQLQQQQQHQQHMQYQNLQNLHQRNQSRNVDYTGLLRKTNATVYQNFAALTERQKLEIDGYISLQNERLRWALQEQRKQQLALMLKKYEAKTQFLLRQKDEQIAKAANRRLELEDFLKKVETEKQAWQRLAKENEAMALSLNNTIEQLRETNSLSTHVVEDAESCCDVIENRGGEKVVGHGEVKPENAEQITRKMVCKGCNFGWSCIIMLPCRHLCMCKACEAFLDSCPVCGVEKKATIEALI